MSESTNSPGDLLRQIEKQGSDKLPPVHLWNPPLCEGVYMGIDGSGVWSFMDSPIRRPRMVRLFSRVLRLDPDGCHYLVTPVEKIVVHVVVTPFRITQWKEDEGGCVVLTTDVNDVVTLGEAHPLRMKDKVPVVEVRSGLQARLERSCYYQLIDRALTEDANNPQLRSGDWGMPLGILTPEGSSVDSQFLSDRP